MVSDGTISHFWEVCEGGINLCIHSFQDFTESAQIETFSAIIGNVSASFS